MIEEIREQYEKETDQSIYDMPEHYHGNGQYCDKYVEWLETKLKEAEEQNKELIKLLDDCDSYLAIMEDLEPKDELLQTLRYKIEKSLNQQDNE